MDSIPDRHKCINILKQIDDGVMQEIGGKIIEAVNLYHHSLYIFIHLLRQNQEQYRIAVNELNLQKQHIKKRIEEDSHYLIDEFFDEVRNMKQRDLSICSEFLAEHAGRIFGFRN